MIPEKTTYADSYLSYPTPPTSIAASMDSSDTPASFFVATALLSVKASSSALAFSSADGVLLLPLSFLLGLPLSVVVAAFQKKKAIVCY